MWKEVPEGIQLAVKVTPKASRSELVGWENEELRIRLAAVPDKGQANEALIRFLSKALRISKSQIAITHGHHSRHKKLLISGVSSEVLRRHLM